MGFKSAAKFVGRTAKDAGKAALDTATPIALDTGKAIGDELLIGIEKIADAFAQRLIEEMHAQTDRVIDAIEKEKRQAGHGYTTDRPKHPTDAT